MVDSILDSTKKALGLELDNTAFDGEVIMHINAVLSTLNQLGAGPNDGFAIEDSAAVWADLLGDDPRLNDIKQYVAMKTRLAFDPPTASGALLTSLKELTAEAEWRINVRREETSWVEPQPVQPLDPEVIIVPVDHAWYSEP